MAEKEISPDVERARQLLSELWGEVTREESGKINHDIEKLINSRKELEAENARLKKMYAEERLMSQIRQEALEGKYGGHF